MTKRKVRAFHRRTIGTVTMFAHLCAITSATGAAFADEQARSPDNLSAAFTICGDRQRVNCVVDGDTFWFQREKVRIADIDAPELSPPRCEDERQRGEEAKQRLLALLNAGSFSLLQGEHDADRYGRRLRIAERNGRSIGSVLVEEKLAREWNESRRPWCE